MSEQPPSIESLLKQVKARGCRVNNMFHRMDGMWQVNLRSRDALSFFEFATGPDPAGALEAALAKADGKKFVRGKRTSDDDLDATQTGLTRHEAASQAASDSDVDAVQSASNADADEDDDLIG